MKANLFYPVLLVFFVPVGSNVLFLPRGQTYAAYNHWSLHLPIETGTSWSYAQKLTHRIEVFKSTFANSFAKHRQQIRSDLIDRLWGKFMHDSDLLDREINVTISALRHLNRLVLPA